MMKKFLSENQQLFNFSFAVGSSSSRIEQFQDYFKKSALFSLLMMALLLFTSLSSWGQLVTEPFNYGVSVATLSTQTTAAWTDVNTGDNILVSSGNLSYSTLPASTGNKIAFDGAGMDANKSFTSQSSGGVYFSFILNVSSLGSLSTTGSYFTGVASNATTFGGVIQIRKSAVDATKYNLGISVTTSSTIAWSSTDYSVGTSYFVTGLYQMVAGTLNDTAKLWINATLGGTETAATASASGGTGTDLASVSQIFLRQAASTTTPFIEMDEMRVGKTWADVTPSASTPTITTGGTIAATNTTYGSASASPTSFTVAGTNMTAGISITPPAGFEVATTSDFSTTIGTSVSALVIGTTGTISTTTVYLRLAATTTVTASPYSGNIACTSSGATAVNLATVSSSVSTKALTISGLTADNKVFDGTTATTFSGTPSLNGIVGADNVILSGTGVANFSDSSVGNGKTVTFTGYSLTGTKVTNYSLTTYTTTANITAGAVLTNQTITFGTLSNHTYGDADFSLGASSDSGLTVSYSSSNTAVATIVSGNIHIIAPGTTTITASQAGNGSYNPATSVGQSLTIDAKQLTVTGAVAQSKPYDGTTAATITGGALVGKVGLDDVSLIGGGTFSDANAGNGITVTANFTLSGTTAGNYSLVQPSSLSANITQVTQTITFAALANKTTLDAPFTLTATGGLSGNAVTFASSNHSVATVSGNTVTIVGAGSTTITASQAGNTNYSAATDVPQTLTVNSILYVDTFTGTAACPLNTGSTPVILTNATGTAPARTTVTCTSTANVFNSSTLNATASVSNTSYIEFSVTANAGYKLDLTSMSFFRQGSNTAPNQLEVRYSTDNFATSTSWGAAPITAASGTVATWDFADFSSTYGGTVKFRLYPYGTQSVALGVAATGGTFRIDDLTVYGTLSTIPAPVINSVLTDIATVGIPYSYNVVATNTPTSYAATGLPSGVTINTTSGLISGTPTQMGSFNVSISATNAGGTDTQTLALSVAQGTQSITFGALASKVYGNANFSLTGTASSGLIVSYASSNTNVATVSGSTVTIVGAGSTTITASQSGNANYTAATSVPQTLTVGKANQTITFGALATKLDTDGSFTLGATSTSGLTISYGSSNSAIVSIIGNTATINGSGTVTITASQAGDTNYNAASSIDQSQVVTNTSMAAQTITFGALASKVYGDANFNLTATSDSGLTVTYTSSDPTVASVSGNIVTIHKPGTTDITASQAGNGSTNPASNVIQTLVVNQKTLTITSVVVADKLYDGTTSATISTYTLNGVVGVDDATVINAPVFTTANVGNGISVTPNFTLQGANSNRYLLTQPVVTGNIVGASQTITFGALASKTFGDATFTLSATGGASGNAVTFVSSDPLIASISGNTVTILAAGTVTITASQAGGGNYNAASDVPQSLVIAQKANIISFSSLTTHYTTDTTFALSATATSLGTVTFTSSNTTVATVSGTTVTIVGVGTTNITASQVGNTNYLAATDVIRTLKITLPPIAAWNVFGLTQPLATATATTFNNLVATGSNATMTRGASAAASSAANSFRTTGFSNNGISTANTDYFQVVLQPTVGHVMSLSTIDAVFAGTTTFVAAPGVTSQFAYSLNGSSFTLIGSPVQSTSLTLSTIDVSGITALQNIPNGTTVTLRYFASGQTTTGGWGFISAAATSSDALAIGGSIITVPPTVSDQSFCNSASVSNLTATGTAIQWYDVITGGAALAPSTALSTGTYYVTQTIGGIESARTAVLVTINNSDAGTITPNQTITWNAQPADISLTNSSGAVQWQSSTNGVSFSNINGATGATLLGTTIGALTSNTYYRAIVTSGNCTSATSTVHSVTIITTTNVRPTQCGTTLSAMDSQILATIYPSAQLYRFEVSNGATVNTYDTTKYNFDLTKVPGTTYATTYGIRVAVKINGVWGNFGTSCNVTTPTLSGNVVLQTKVNPAYCGITLPSIDTKIPASIIQNATGYRFEIISGGVTTTYDSATYNFKLSQAGIAAYGTTYSIRVAALVNGFYGNYGASCSITTPSLTVNIIPTTSIMSSFCGTTLSALDTKIPASIVSGASGYRFEIITGGITTVYDSATYNFKLSQSGVVVEYGTTYLIRVAALVSGTYGNYGASCNITTPVLSVNTVPTTTIQPSFCGATLATLDTKIGAVMVTGATKGRFEVTIAGGSPIVYEVAAYNFKLSQTGVAVLYNKDYSIRVAALVGGVWGNYGASCTVTTPSAPAPARLKAKTFEVSAYPNPFDTAFNLSIETPNKEDITIAVYDMMGKLVETHQVNPMEIANLQIGNNFAAGIYNVIVSQANEMQAIRLIRK
jgi:hypothetical protein